MDDGSNKHDDPKTPNWVDRNLGKILVAAAVICALGLVGRVLTR